MSMLPLAASGIEVTGYRLTKRQLLKWKEHGTPHVVLLYTLGGVFTSEGNGIYTSFERQFDTAEDFWQFARDFRQRALMAET